MSICVSIETDIKTLYPYIGFSEKHGIYVLFYGPNIGTVIGFDSKPKHYHHLGEYSKGWCETDYFVRTTDKIVLQNA